jgi:hypothetical protein
MIAKITLELNMRNGDVYKIKSMHRTGSSDKDIIQYMSRKYPEAEVRRFIPGAAEKVAKAAKVKAEAAEDSAAEAAVEAPAETEPKKQVTRGKKKSKA